MAGKLGRDSSARKAVLRDLVSALIQHERITTTLAKAKETQRVFDKMITIAKKGTIAARRDAASFLRDYSLESNQTLVQKLFSDLAPRFESRQGGYTRIYKLEDRLGDGAKMALIELV